MKCSPKMTRAMKRQCISKKGGRSLLDTPSIRGIYAHYRFRLRLSKGDGSFAWLSVLNSRETRVWFRTSWWLVYMPKQASIKASLRRYRLSSYFGKNLLSSWVLSSLQFPHIRRNFRGHQFDWTYPQADTTQLMWYQKYQMWPELFHVRYVNTSKVIKMRIWISHSGKQL